MLLTRVDANPQLEFPLLLLLRTVLYLSQLVQLAAGLVP